MGFDDTQREPIAPIAYEAPQVVEAIAIEALLDAIGPLS